LLLPTAYFQIVLTIPIELHRLFRRAPKMCLGDLFDAVAETLAEVAKTKLKATIGFTLVLHTWNQKLGFHPHIHCVVPGGGLSLDKTRWVPTSTRFFLPVKVLRKVFRGKLLAKLEAAIRSGDLPGNVAQNLGRIRSTPKTWNVYTKRPLAGPGHVVRYLSRYVHRIAIANSRIADYDGENVTFRYKDRRDGGRVKTRTVGGATFAKLFLQHVLPRRFVRIRHYGFLSPRRRKDLARCRELLGAAPMAPRDKDPTWVAAFQRLFGANPLACPACRTGVMIVREILPPIRR
jgi:hypothetical protein